MKNDLLPRHVKRDKVAIVGYGDSRRLVPYDDEAWEIWGLNDLYKQMRRYDRWFELHKRRVNLEDEGPEHIWTLAGLRCPIYMIEHNADIPTSVAYPLDRVLKAFRPYLTSSFSYMAALAILEGFTEIGVYGVDTPDEEWGTQRPSLEYLLGYAEGKGIKVTIPAESTLLRAPFLYGYQEREEQEFFGKLANIEHGYERSVVQAGELRERYALREARYRGAMAALEALRKEWRAPFQYPKGEDVADGE